MNCAYTLYFNDNSIDPKYSQKSRGIKCQFHISEVFIKDFVPFPPKKSPGYSPGDYASKSTSILPLSLS
jgi:hypothetical protein